MKSPSSRRSFLKSTSVVVGASVAGAGVASATQNRKPFRRKQVVAGSPSPAFSRAVVVGRLLFVAGVVGRKPGEQRPTSDDFESQCRQALTNLKASVEAGGAAMINVVKCNCFLTDGADFATFDRVYQAFFPEEPPARSTVVVKELVVPGAKLEIDCVAALD